ncbi:MAG: hypothetical protein COW19_00950 [Zetaproteobacteria bacterium CG12_big_fil_rev_8_21_14_0_65_55_1124]|nr:MAG: hypothetical protein AUJ58_11215 [Zetaproteobacteria bacterium CG1_02_55_237]PIS19185.1 MAG: hypothetical protein COT53_07285 [Zetaproteobacteria bacterium CG08_land_8_20_14_0_20_55_17]PIW43880.1 MAG: hypothetical protein COW19_00950 [Zetaproteobacteria bacterium CG12_big_fil_rev_8_21_14_0_65_55_1124]PIY53026.1 MAG: hypothetical protein COZ01_05690 [Zetaproteobacteria bacterium CG_4_10_14_0_8_um_filter_55_43]PIZ37660.1 MAG: hypothetical protein COY36_08890 [Zetaproteobacteria bacterium 
MRETTTDPKSSQIHILADFLQFIGEARTFLKQTRVSKDHPDVLQIRSQVEEKYDDDRGRPAVYQKFESTFFEDAPDIVTLWVFFQKYEHDQLRRYRRLTRMELGGLTGDRHPMAILGRTLLGTAALILTGVTTWWGIIKLVSGDDPMAWSSQLSHLLLSPAGVNQLAGIIWLTGMFIVIWYVLRMVRNRKQVAFLASLSRALDMYLSDTDSN